MIGNEEPDVEVKQLEERIAAFPGWHYRFEFDNGVSTPVSDRSVVNRHEQRRRYFFERLLAITGDSLAGRRVLDLGCNAGFWSLAAIDAGADFVLGLDGRQAYIDQATLVFEQKAIDPSRYRFEQGDVLGHDLGAGFDVVLCLGLMDHLARPVELFERMADVGAELIVIDTAVSRARASLFELSSLYDRRDVMADHALVLIPSRPALVALAAQFGYEAVPLALNITDYAGMQDYRRKRRLAFICAKGRSEARPEAEPPPSLIPWWIRDPRALLTA